MTLVERLQEAEMLATFMDYYAPPQWSKRFAELTGNRGRNMIITLAHWKEDLEKLRANVKAEAEAMSAEDHTETEAA
ncbi:MAG: hypothetical protein JWO40_28 [Candidatus Doudnabacteria bacterium]|nr:hypothetical protein [Candidatus Doudnabacteria bacterium]